MSRRPKGENAEAGTSLVRLQKFLADAGVGSRRACEELIQEGRVQVDRKEVTELGTKVDPSAQEVRLDGLVIRPKRHKYYMVNKPTGVVCTNSDPEGRTRVIDLISTDERLFTVGRLDRTSEGLILVTNDGDLANQLTHPRYGVEKTYIVRVAGRPTYSELEPLKEGVRLAEGVAKVDSLRIRKRHHNATELEIILREGRNREIRRLLAKIGHKVVNLKRIAVSEIRLGALPSAGVRQLTAEEIKILRKAAAKAGGKRRAPGKKTSKRRTTKQAPAAAGRSGRRAKSSSVPGKRPKSASGRKTKVSKKRTTRKTTNSRSSSTASQPTSRRKGSVLGYNASSDKDKS